jgi:subtilisin-like proprotein convertase family protein
MSKAIHAREFYVVGGPVQPDRACYVERAADGELEAAVRARRLCYVLGPRGIGKSSLVHRVARKLRDSRELVAVIDLVQLGALTERETSHGWVRALAERIVRELGIKIDVRGWWQAGSQNEGERLVDFLWGVVLTNTTAPITVFVDGFGAVGNASFAAELNAVVERCYARRSTDPDFGRLSFVLTGSTSRRAFAGGQRAPPLAGAETIELTDFSASESYTLARGFEGEPELAQALMDRVRGWTGGHPYLTQKVARSVVRKGGKLEDVERVVREQLLAPGAAETDPFLNHVRSWLHADAPGARRTARLLRRLAHGRNVVAPADPLVLERLHLSGVVLIDGRRVEFRNRVFKELAGRWLQAEGRVWRLAAAAAVLLLVAAAGVYWYVQYLPTADIATLESATASPAGVDDAYRRLRALPGFNERADRLYAAALVRRSGAAETLAAAVAADARLRGLPGQDGSADRLFADFWMRRLTEAKHAEQRDAALLYAVRMASLPAGAAAAGQLAELVDADYPHLTRTLHLRGVPPVWGMRFTDSTLFSLDADQQLQRTVLGGPDGAVDPAPVRMTAVQHAALTRELAVDGDGSAGAFELSVALQHPAAGELLVTLTAPDGAEASLTLPHSEGAAIESFVFDAGRGTPLAGLADAGRRGTWRLTLVDRRPGSSGTLMGWGLRFGDDAWRDDPLEPLPIPAPTRTEAVTVTAVGSWALVQPQSQGPIGAVALWNLAAGQLERDFALPATPRHVAVNAAGSRLIAAGDKLVGVWDTADGARVARLATDTEFVLPPALSADGGYFAIAERVEEGRPLYSVLRTDDGSLVGSFQGADGVERWWLGPGARYIAVQGPANVVRVLGRRGEVLQSLAHAHAVARVLPLPDGATLLTIDDAGAIFAWPLGRGAATHPRPLGIATAAADVDVAAGGTRLAYSTRDATVVVADVATAVDVVRVRQAGPLPVSARLSDDGLKLVTWNGSELRRWDLPGAAGKTAEPSVTAAVAPTAVAIDRGTGRVAIGTADGRLEIDATQDTQTGAPESLEYLGHRGAVTAVAVDMDHGVAITGGADGTLRAWDTSGLTPPAVVGQPAPAPVSLLALDANARLVASAAGASVRVAAVADGTAVVERSMAGPVTALAFAAGGDAIAIGDAAGGVTVVPFAAARASFNVRLMAAVTAIAFAPSGERLAVGDTGGGLSLLQTADGSPVGVPRKLAEAVRWLDFERDDDVLVAVTPDWLHAFRAATGLEPWQSRFAPRPLGGAALTLGEGATLRVAELETTGAVRMTKVDLAAAPAAVTPPARDWPTVLGLTLDEAGNPVRYDP